MFATRSSLVNPHVIGRWLALLTTVIRPHITVCSISFSYSNTVRCLNQNVLCIFGVAVRTVVMRKPRSIHKRSLRRSRSGVGSAESIRAFKAHEPEILLRLGFWRGSHEDPRNFNDHPKHLRSSLTNVHAVLKIERPCSADATWTHHSGFVTCLNHPRELLENGDAHETRFRDVQQSERPHGNAAVLLIKTQSAPS